MPIVGAKGFQGEALKLLLKARGISRADLARSLGRHPLTVDAWIYDRQRPPAALMPEVCAALECEPENLGVRSDD